MRAALALLFSVAACGGSNKQAGQSTSLTNKTGSVEPAAQGPGEGRLIQRMQMGGVIELSGDRSAAMKQADEQMSAHCGPNNYTIVQEGEEAIAEESTGRRTATAWRVHYQCNGAQGY
jgi:hypothetical protein